MSLFLITGFLKQLTESQEKKSSLLLVSNMKVHDVNNSPLNSVDFSLSDIRSYKLQKL